MKFFIDSADIEEIQKANQRGWVDGVTTNPSLIAKSGKDLKSVIGEIAKEIKGPISAEVISLQAEQMYEEGLELAKIADNVVIKVPMCEEGLVAVRRFSSEGIKTNVTLVFSAIQALLVAKAGGTFVSPFVGRLDDVGTQGMNLIDEIVQIYRQYDFDTEILVASIRHPAHILEAAMMGADVSTIPYKVLQQLCKHPLTDIGIEKFLNDHKASLS